MRIRQYWLIIFLALGTAVFIFYKQQQDPITYHFAEDFDGNDYKHIYNYFTGTEENYVVEFPFHQRILVPFLAAQINSGDIISDFQWVNLFFTMLVIVVLFYLWRILGFDLKWIWFGFIWLLFHWSGLIRLNAFDPVTVDLPLYTFQGILLIFLFKRKFVHLLWLAPLATIQKESFIGLMVILCLYAWWHNKKTKEEYFEMSFILAATILAISAQSVVNYNFSPAQESKGAFITLAFHGKEAVLNPFEIVRWLAAISMAFGPAIWLSFYNYYKTGRYDNKRNLLLLLSCLSLAYGILAGGDMTRIVFLGFPFIMTWILFELKNFEKGSVLWLIILSLPLFMFHAQIPDPAWQRSLWESWYPEFNAPILTLTVLAYVMIISIGIFKKTMVHK